MIGHMACACDKFSAVRSTPSWSLTVAKRLWSRD